MGDKENFVKEQRLIKATTNNLTGLDGKIGQILKYMGDPVISQESSFFSSTEWPDVYEVPNDDMPTQDMEAQSIEEGKILSCLKWGINMELSYFKESLVQIKITDLHNEWIQAEKVMTVNYQGYVVYREIEGDLETYIPMPEWEQAIDRIYEYCKKIKKVAKSEREEEKKEESKIQKLGIIARLREKWGI